VGAVQQLRHDFLLLDTKGPQFLSHVIQRRQDVPYLGLVPLLLLPQLPSDLLCQAVSALVA
jgi:hypothetical protein